MRIIKFKGKSLSDGKWVEGYFYEECDNTYIIENRQSKSMLSRNIPVKVDPSTVCQFTGLKDKKGKEVWEHDILTSPCLKAEVVFRNGCFRVKKDDGSSFPFSTLFIIDGKIDYCSIIENKFDRKEVNDKNSVASISQLKEGKEAEDD